MRLMVAGGSASGKSEWAEQKVAGWAFDTGLPVTYIATAEVHDPDFAERVRLHQQRRPLEWGLVEVPDELPALLEQVSGQNRILLVDSTGTWLAGRIWRGSQESGWSLEQKSLLKDEIDRLAQSLASFRGYCMLVADEVGMGIIPETEMGRLFRDFNGLLNRRLAEVSDEVYQVSCGLPIRLK